MRIDFNRFWRSTAAGLCGSIAHNALMALKSWAGWLPGFQPYKDLQAMLTALAGTSVPAFVPWLLTYFNGAVVLGFLFGRFHRLIPGGNAAMKGIFFGLAVWAVMGLLMFPMLGKGLFAAQTELGLLPTLFTLAMVLTYSIALGLSYAFFDRR